jgi:selenoprotein W-related protein
VFIVTYDDVPIWERKADGGFPDTKTLKQRVRNRLDPGRNLGHIDRATADPDKE